MRHKHPVITNHPLSFIAEQFKANPEQIVFGHEGSTFTTVRLLPTACSVVEKVADALGSLADRVHLQTQDVPEDKDGRAMATGLVIPVEYDRGERWGVLDKLNTFLPEGEKFENTPPEEGQPTIISQDQLTKILAGIRRRELAARDAAEATHAR